MQAHRRPSIRSGCNCRASLLCAFSSLKNKKKSAALVVQFIPSPIPSPIPIPIPTPTPGAGSMTIPRPVTRWVRNTNPGVRGIEPRTIVSRERSTDRPTDRHRAIRFETTLTNPATKKGGTTVDIGLQSFVPARWTCHQ